MARDRDKIERKLSRVRCVRRGGWAGLIALIVSIILDRSGTFGYRGDDQENFDQSRMLVKHVWDGDTVVVRDGEKEERVRLIGIDAPELSDDAYWSTQSKRYLAARAEGKDLILRIEPSNPRDRHGRLLAYLFTEAGENLNESALRDGQAYADRRHDHTFRGQFEAAETEARRKDRGLWKEVAEAQMPEWRKRWLADRRERESK